MTVQNGVEVYEHGEKLRITDEVPANFAVYSPFGFKIVEINGKRMWGVATEDDAVKTLAQFLGISEEKARLNLDKSCYATAPGLCAAGQCLTGSGAWGYCTPVFNPDAQVAGCFCV
jgi:hypothetical protein